MALHTARSRVTRFSLPAERSASSVLCRFIRDAAQDTRLSAAEVDRLQSAVTEAFHGALAQQEIPGEGRVALKIDVNPDEITVDLTYRETHFPPAEISCKS
ncbi:MAG: hypothetical protein ACYC2Y_05985 [Armatimonadota bacterium]